MAIEYHVWMELEKHDGEEIESLVEADTTETCHVATFTDEAEAREWMSQHDQQSALRFLRKRSRTEGGGRSPGTIDGDALLVGQRIERAREFLRGT